MHATRPVLALLLLSLGVLGGCAAAQEEGDGAEVGETNDAIIGGTATFDRPEIGIVFHANSLCTGTLVRPNVVLTAMHCTGIAKDQDVSPSSTQPGFVFEIRKSATERHRYFADRLTTITVGTDLDGSQRWRSKDIALLRLVEDVPAAIARPANIAPSWPRLFGSVSIYGYGCTDRAAGPDGRRPGSGTKRKKDYTWSLGLFFGFSDTQNSCPGDSGGPLLDLERNAVLGTTSGYVDGDDRFGDVPANYRAVTAIAGCLVASSLIRGEQEQKWEFGIRNSE